MKNNGKTSKPIIAAHSAKNNVDRPAPPAAGKGNGKQVRGSRASGSDPMRVQVLERISDGLLALDAGMNHVYVNERAGELLGRQPEELIGKNFWEVYPNSVHTPFGDACRRAFEMQTVVPFDGYFPASNAWFEGRVYPSDDGLSVLMSDRPLPEQEDMIKALEKSEEKFSRAFHLSPSAIAILRLQDGQLIDVNQNFLNLFGFDDMALIGKTTADVGIQISPTLLEEVAQTWREQGRIEQQELDIQIRTGEQRHILLSVESIEIEGEACVLASLLDITERRRTEERIREMSEFPMQNPNPVLRFTPRGDVLFANPASAPLLAFWKSQDDSGIPRHWRQVVRSTYESGKNYETELEYEGRILSTLLVPLPDRNYVNAYCLDVTATRQVEASLSAISRQTTAGLTRTDRDGRFLFVNQAFCDMVGYAASELIGRTIWDISHPDDVARNRRLFEHMLVDGDSFQLEKRILRRSGATLWVNVSTSPVRDAAGQVQSAVSIIVDITRRKLAEESLLEGARRTLYLSTLSDTLRPLSDPDQIAEAATRVLGTHLQTSRVAYAEARPDGTFGIRRQYGDGVAAMAGEVPMARYIPAEFQKKFQAGRLLTISDVAKDTAYHPAERTALEAESTRAQVILPIVREGSLVAALFVQQEEPRLWKSDEIRLMEETVERMQAGIEHAEAEQRLHDSEQRIRLMANTVPSVVWTAEPDGTVTFVNEHWYHYTGLSPDADINAGFEQIVHPDDRARYREESRHALQVVPDEYAQELRLRRYDGQYRWFQTRARPARDEAGRVTAWYGVSTDIHDRMEREHEIQQLINNTPFMLTRCSRDMRYRFVSRVYAEMIGRSPEELAGRPLVEIMGEAGVERIRPYVEQVLQGQRVEYEMEVPLSGFKTPVLHVTYTPDYDENGEVIGWFASIMDITERKQMENKLRESERKFSLIYDYLPFAAALSRPQDGVIVDVNREFERIFGYSKPQVIGKTSLELGINPDAESHKWILAELQAHGSVRNYETTLSTQNQGIRQFSINLDVVSINGEEYILQTTQDITERNRMEAALHESEERFRAIVNQATAGIVRKDASGRLLFANGAFCQMLGYSSDELLHKSMWEITHTDDIPENRRLFDRLMAEGIPFQLEKRLNRKDGSLLWTTVSVSPVMDAAGKPQYAVSVYADITERKRIEEELQKSAEFNDFRVTLADALRPLHEPSQILLEAMQILGERLQVDRVLYSEIEDDDETIRILDNYVKEGIPPLVGRASLSDYGKARAPLSAGQNLVIVDASSSPDMDEKDRAAFAALGIRSGLGIPLIKGGRWVATLGVHHGAARTWSANEIKFAEETAERTWSALERARIQQALRTSEEKYRRIVETANEGIWEIDKDARTLFVNARMAEILGYTPEEMLGRSAFEFILPEDYQAGQQMLEHAKQNLRANATEFRYRRKDGSVIWLLASRNSYNDAQGNFQGAVAMLTDITERKEYEQTLIEYARRQSALYSLADQLNRTQTLEDVYSAALDSIANALQCDRASILLFGQDNLMHFVAWRGLSDAYRKATDGHSPWKIDERNPIPIYYNELETADLSEALKSVIQNEGIDALAFIPIIFQGRLIGKFMIYYNTPHIFREAELNLSLTIARQLASAIDRRRAEQALRESQQRLALTYQHAPIGIVETTLEGRYLEANEQFCSMLGYPYEELLTLAISDVTYGEDQKDHELYQQLVKGEIPFYRIEKRYIRKDGSLLWSELVRAMVHDEDGTPLYGIGAILDVSERKQREEALRARTEEIETLMEVSPIGIFVAHDPACARITANPAGYHLVEMPEGSSGNMSKSAPEEERPTYRVFRHGVELSAEELPMQVAVRLGMEIEEEDLELRFDNGSRKFIYVYAKPLFDPEGRERGAIAAMLDITERKQKEEALRARTEEVEALMQLSPIGIMVAHDPECTQITGNPAAYELLRVPIEARYENLSRPALDVAGPSHRVFHNGVELGTEDLPMQASARLGREVKIEDLELRFEDGQRKYTYIYSKPLFDSQGKSRGAIAAMLDVTERKRAEEALRLDATIMENVPAGVYLVRASDGIIVHANPQFDQLFGYEPGEILGQPVSVLNAPNGHSPQEMADAIVVALKEHGAWQGEVYSVRKDGTPFWCFASVTTFEHATYGSVWVGARQDITERKQAENALRQSEERFTQFMQYLPGLAWIKDLQGRYIYANAAAAEAFRTPIAELYGKTDEEIFAPEVALQFRQNDERVLREDAGLQAVETLEHEAGVIHYSLVNKFPIPGPSGGIALIGGTAFDITERKQAEDRLALLAEISDLIRKFEDPIELMSAVATATGSQLQVKRCLFNEIDVEHDLEIVHRDYHADDTPSVEGEHGISEYSSITTAEMQTGKTIVNADSKTDPRTAHDYERSYFATGERAYVAVPMMRDGRWVASLWVSDDKPRTWSPEDVSLLETIAERTWTATEKLRIHAALRDSEERLRVTFNTTAVGFATLRPDTQFVEVNQAFCDIVGYSRDELLQMNCNSLTHPDYMEGTQKHVAELLAGEVPSFVLEKEYIRKDGTQIWVQNSVSLVRDADGRPLHMIVISQDITARKQAEEALQDMNQQLENRVQRRTAELQAAYEFLRESEATSRLIIESMPDAIVITDKLGIIVHCNTQVEALFGYTPSEILGQPVERLLPERYHGQHVKERTDFNRDRHRRNMGLGRELFGRRKDGSEFPVDVMLSPISNSTTWDVMVTIRDNTEQKQAQEALRANEEKLRKLFEILPVGISFLNNEGRIIELNNTLSQIMGLSKNDLMQSMFKGRRYIHADGSAMPPRDFASIRAKVEEKPVYDVETGIIKENGEVIWTSVSAAPVDVADVDVVVATTDITERKKAEDALRKHRERLRNLSRRLVEVQEDERRAIARELHDRVGQNLAALNLNLNILRSQLSSDALERIGSRITDSVSLVNQILTITRNVMADLRSNVLDDYGLEAALREYADQFTQRTGIKVVAYKPPMAIPRFDASIEMTLLRITQEALTNIARHAQASEASIFLRLDNDILNMSIEDNGIGILSWQKANRPGSHGLRIIRERAEAFGGSVQIHSTYKKGTKIEVKIPITNEIQQKVPREKRS